MYWNEFGPLQRKAPVKLVRSYSVLIYYYEVRSDKSLLNHLTKMYIPTDVTNMYIPTEKRKRKIKCYLLIP